MKELKVGVLGAGNIGTAHANNIFAGKIAGMRLTALCDSDPVVRERLEKYQVPVFASGEEMMDSGLVDCVIVSVPHYFHPYFVEQALKRDIHVISEKPAGVQVSRVRKAYGEIGSSRARFGIMFNQRTDPLFQKARAIIRGGGIGVPKRIVWIVTNWYRTQNYYDSGSWRATWNGEGGGVLLNQAPHNLDLWQWLFGMPDRIRAFCSEGKYHRISVEDDATIYAEYDNGATGVFITTTGDCPGTNRLEITGDRGRLVLEKGELRYTKLKIPEREFCFMSDAGFALPPTEEQIFREEGSRDGHELILENFAAAALRGEEMISPGTDGIRELMISNAAYLSSWTDSWVELPLDDAACEAFDKLLEEKRQKECKKDGRSEDGGLGHGDYVERWSVRW